MKQRILITTVVLSAFFLTAFVYVNRSNNLTDRDRNAIDTYDKPGEIDLVYNVASRFSNTVTMEKVNKAKSIIDILPARATKSVASFHDVRVAILDKENAGNEIAHEVGGNEVLNTAQIKLLQSTDYSTQIYIKANYGYRYEIAGTLNDGDLTYSMTIIPENEAEFIDGYDALINYLRANSKEQTSSIKRDQLKPGRVSFTVTKKGTIANVSLNSTSGYPSVDEALVELITDMPENWKPATNSKGEKVDQELIFFFGLQGC